MRYLITGDQPISPPKSARTDPNPRTRSNPQRTPLCAASRSSGRNGDVWWFNGKVKRQAVVRRAVTKPSLPGNHRRATWHDGDAPDWLCSDRRGKPTRPAHRRGDGPLSDRRASGGVAERQAGRRVPAATAHVVCLAEPAWQRALGFEPALAGCFEVGMAWWPEDVARCHGRRNAPDIVRHLAAHGLLASGSWSRAGWRTTLRWVRRRYAGSDIVFALSGKTQTSTHRKQQLAPTRSHPAPQDLPREQPLTARTTTAPGTAGSKARRTLHR